MKQFENMRLSFGFLVLAGMPPYLVYDVHRLAQGESTFYHWFNLVLAAGTCMRTPTVPGTQAPKRMPSASPTSSRQSVHGYPRCFESLLLAGDYEHLFAEDSLYQRNFQIGLDEEAPLGETTPESVGQKTGLEGLYLKARCYERFAHAFVAKRDLMVEKVPIMHREVLDVRPHHYQLAARGKYPVDRVQRIDDPLAIGQVLEKVRREKRR